MEKSPKSSIFSIVALCLTLLGVLGVGYWIMKGSKKVPQDTTEMPDFNESKSVSYKVVDDKFSAKYPKDMVVHSRDSLPWSNQMAKNDAFQGVLGAFTLSGRDVSIRQPYIQVGYIWRGNKPVSTPDSAMTQTEKMILSATESKILTPRTIMRTQNGAEFLAAEYEWGKRSFNGGEIEKKYVSYAFMPLNQDYLISYSLTARNAEDFKNLLPNFYYIVKGSK